MVTTSPIRIGTRNSSLALAQAQQIADALGSAYEIVPIVSSGDKIPGPLRDHGGKFLFTKEIDTALITSEIDLAVHSMKDVETPLVLGLEIGAITMREDPRDALIYNTDRHKNAITKVGTSSLRRARQLGLQNPNMTIVPCRGNIQTRLKKLANKEFDGLVLAIAGLKRLGIWRETFIEEIDAKIRVLDINDYIPAPGQGALVVLKREDDHRFDDVLGLINHQESLIAIQIERMIVDALNLTCHDPIGVYACVDEQSFSVNLILFDHGPSPIEKNLTGNLENRDYLVKKLIDDVKKACEFAKSL